MLEGRASTQTKGVIYSITTGIPLTTIEVLAYLKSDHGLDVIKQTAAGRQYRASFQVGLSWNIANLGKNTRHTSEEILRMGLAVQMA